MYHGKMTARMYNIWSLAYRTHSLIFVRHRYDLLCVLLCYNDPSNVFFYHRFVSFLPIQVQRQAIGSKCNDKKGYNNRDTVREVKGNMGKS